MENETRQIQKRTAKILIKKDIVKYGTTTVSIMFKTSAGEVLYAGLVQNFTNIKSIDVGDTVYTEFFRDPKRLQAEIEVMQKVDPAKFASDSATHNAAVSVDKILLREHLPPYGDYTGEIPEVLLRHIVRKYSPTNLHAGILLMECVRDEAETIVTYEVPVLGNVTVRSAAPWRDYVRRFASTEISAEDHETEAMRRAVVHAISAQVKKTSTERNEEYAAWVAVYQKTYHVYEQYSAYFSTPIQSTVDFSEIHTELLPAYY